MEQRLKDSTIIDLAASSHFVQMSKKGENPVIFVYEHKMYTAFSKGRRTGHDRILLR